MAVRLARAAAVLLLVLLLGSCQVLQFIFGSVFPSTVTLVKARVDLSASITAADGTFYNLRVVESGGFGYVVLVGAAGLVAFPPAYIYDLDLNLKKTLPAPSADGVMVDGSGAIVVGNTALVPADLSPATGPPGAGIFAQGFHEGTDGFFNAAGGLNAANLRIPQNTTSLAFDLFTSPGWTNAGSVNPGPSLSATMTGIHLVAILGDGDPTGNVILVISQEGQGNSVESYFITMPKSSFNLAAPGGAGLLDVAPHRGGLVASSFGLVDRSIVAWDQDAQSFVRLDPVTLATTSSFYAPASTDSMRATRFAYAARGFYTYNPDTRVITEYAPWW